MEQTVKGKILKGVGGLYSVRLLSDLALPRGSVISCRARGSFRHDRLTPLPGDTVDLVYQCGEQGSDTASFVIDRIGERRNALIRPPMANLDFLFITFACTAPAPILPTIDKLIAIAEYNHIEPVIVITKSELAPDVAAELLSIYETCGFSCFSVSAEADLGLSSLKEWIEEKLPGHIAAFAGASGIGKSTLMNHLFPTLSLSTSEISRKIQRGRHTTRQVELFPLFENADCGYIADTPGFSMLDFERFDFFDKEDLPTTMREFLPYLGSCRYTKCSHTKEDGCAILEAVHKGVIPPSRHASYTELYQTLKSKSKWN